MGLRSTPTLWRVTLWSHKFCVSQYLNSRALRLTLLLRNCKKCNVRYRLFPNMANAVWPFSFFDSYWRGKAP